MSTQQPVLITQADREQLLIQNPAARAFKKRARILATLIDLPFTVETDRGPMTGSPGDFLVTNHPDDDPGSDVWSISAERMAATYSPALESNAAPESRIRLALEELRERQAAGGREQRDRHRAVAITKLEEALLWMAASDVL